MDATAGSILLFGACEKSEIGSGTLNLSITDAPTDSAGVRGVYIAINRISYYHLAYLAPGSYDLVVVSANENGVSVLSIEEQLGVESRQNTKYDIVLGVEVEVEIEAGTATEE